MKAKGLAGMLAFGAIAALAGAAVASAADATRGAALYEAQCKGCHNESVHNDASRKAHNFEQARARVGDFGARLKTGWTAAQIDDVAVYLNERYYRFPCPPKLCPSPAPAKR